MQTIKVDDWFNTRLLPFNEGCAVFCFKDAECDDSSLACAEDVCFIAGLINEALNLVEETEPAKFSECNSYPSLQILQIMFYEISVTPIISR